MYVHEVEAQLYHIYTEYIKHLYITTEPIKYTSDVFGAD